MPNNFGNSYSSYFHIIKTTKPINEIIDHVSDRLIITKEGRMYFDYSDSERIEISNKSESYRYNGEFGDVNVEQTISYSDLYDYNGVRLDTKQKEIVVFTIIFDNNGNIGVITEIDSINSICKILTLTNAVSINMLNDRTNIKRIEY